MTVAATVTIASPSRPVSSRPVLAIALNTAAKVVSAWASCRAGALTNQRAPR